MLLRISLATMIAGCATIFNKNIRTITIESDPSAADVKGKDGKILGTTPYSFTPSKEEKYSFAVSKKGFEESEIQIRPMVRESALFGDALLLCIPCFVDLPSKAYLQFEHSNYKLDLHRSSNEREHENSMFSEDVFVNINEVQLGFKNAELLGKVNSSNIKYNSNKEQETTGNSVVFTDQVCREFKQFNITSLKCGINRFQREGANMLAPDKQLFIQPVVESWNMNLTTKKKIYFGSGTMVVIWKILDPTQNMKVIHESKTTTRADFDDKYLKYFFLKLIQKSVDTYIETDSVYSFLKNRSLNMPEMMKGESVEIKRNINPKFDKLKDLVSYCTKAVVTVKQKDGFGSAVIVSSSGFMITNYHVVENNKEVTVKLSSGISLNAKVVKTNPTADLALLKIEADGLTALPFSESSVEVGEEVVAIGTPGDLSLEQTVSKGIVSGKRVFEGKNFLQTDVSINPGNSGGPLLNDKGELLGIISMKLVGKGMEGLGFALSAEDVIKLLNLKIK